MPSTLGPEELFHVADRGVQRECGLELAGSDLPSLPITTSQTVDRQQLQEMLDELEDVKLAVRASGRGENVDERDDVCEAGVDDGGEARGGRRVAVVVVWHVVLYGVAPGGACGRARVPRLAQRVRRANGDVWCVG